jgi:signal transduction histidine kinase
MKFFRIKIGAFIVLMAFISAKAQPAIKGQVSNVEIKAKDNWKGIPQKIVDKIFQPFFTTKPTGQGTGLGLSLSYDIVKAHGWEIKVESKEGEGSEFIIQISMFCLKINMRGCHFFG